MAITVVYQICVEICLIGNCRESWYLRGELNQKNQNKMCVHVVVTEVLALPFAGLIGTIC